MKLLRVVVFALTVVVVFCALTFGAGYAKDQIISDLKKSHEMRKQARIEEMAQAILLAEKLGKAERVE